MKEAGAESLSFQLLNRNVDQPLKYVATWLIDEWSKIGLHVTPALAQHACCCSQHLQPSTPSRLAFDAPDLPSRGHGSMEKCGCRSVIAYSAWHSFCSREVNLTMRDEAMRRLADSSDVLLMEVNDNRFLAQLRRRKRALWGAVSTPARRQLGPQRICPDSLEAWRRR